MATGTDAALAELAERAALEREEALQAEVAQATTGGRAELQAARERYESERAALERKTPRSVSEHNRLADVQRIAGRLESRHRELLDEERGIARAEWEAAPATRALYQRVLEARWQECVAEDALRDDLVAAKLAGGFASTWLPQPAFRGPELEMWARNILLRGVNLDLSSLPKEMRARIEAPR